MRRVGWIVIFLLLLSPVFCESKPISFSANRMSGSAGKKNSMTVLDGNAVVTVGSLKISGDRIELSGKDYRFITASGNVQGSDSDQGFSFSAGELSYDRDTEIASFRGNAKLTDSKNDVEASASIISYNQKTETAFFQVGVTLKRKEIACSAGFALYRRKLSLLDLSGSPKVDRSGDEFRADRIMVNLDSENIVLDGTVSGSLKEADAPKDKETPPKKEAKDEASEPKSDASKDKSAPPDSAPPPAQPSETVTETPTGGKKE